MHQAVPDAIRLWTTISWHWGCSRARRLTGGLVMATRAAARELDDVYELPPVDGAGAIPDEWQSSATYDLEMAVRCPHCDEAIRTIRIVGLSRSQVAFTSTLPRKG